MKFPIEFYSKKGGISFIGLKGILKIYYKQQQFLRQAHRQIKNYEPNTSSSSTSVTHNQTTQTSSNTISSQNFQSRSAENANTYNFYETNQNTISNNHEINSSFVQTYPNRMNTNNLAEEGTSTGRSFNQDILYETYDSYIPKSSSSIDSNDHLDQ